MTTPHRSPRSLRWRLLTFVAGVGGGLLFLTSWLTSGGGDIRAGSVTDLASVVRRQKAETDAQLAQARDLAALMDEVAAGRGGARVPLLAYPSSEEPCSN